MFEEPWGRTIGRSAKMNTTLADFWIHFVESVSSDQYEERPDVIERDVRGTVYLKNDSKTKEKNERLKEVSYTEEIMEAIKETRDSAPGVDEARIGFIRKAWEMYKVEWLRLYARCSSKCVRWDCEGWDHVPPA